MRVLLGVLAIGCVCVLSSCRAFDIEDPVDVPVASVTDQEIFEMAVGESILLVKWNSTVRFLSIPFDTRCPVGSECPSAGIVEIRLRLTTQGREIPFAVSGFVGPDGEGANASGTVQNLRFTLLRLDPYPGTPVVGNTAPVATLQIDLL